MGVPSETVTVRSLGQMAYSRAEAIGIRLSHQSGQVGGDLNGLGFDREILLFGYPAEHEGEPGAESHGQAPIGGGTVPDDGRAAELVAESGPHQADDGRVGLACHRRFDSRRCGDGGENGSSTGNGSVRSWVGGVIVRADEPSSPHYGSSGTRQTVVVEVPMPTDNDRIGGARPDGAHA